MSRVTSPCVRCEGWVWLSTDRLGRTVEVCTGPCAYRGAPRPSGAALKAHSPATEEAKRARRKVYNARQEARGVKR